MILILSWEGLNIYANKKQSSFMILFLILSWERLNIYANKFLLMTPANVRMLLSGME